MYLKMYALQKTKMLRSEHEAQLRALRCEHEDECRRLQEELDIQKTKVFPSTPSIILLQP